MFIGKTLKEVAEEAGFALGGYSIMILQDEEDTTGKLLDTSPSIKAVVEEHPEIVDYKVKFENEYFGELVLRVIKEQGCMSKEVSNSPSPIKKQAYREILSAMNDGLYNCGMITDGKYCGYVYEDVVKLLRELEDEYEIYS